MKLKIPFSQGLPQLLSIARAYDLKLSRAKDFERALAILKSRIKLN